MVGAKPSSTPISTNLKLDNTSGDILSDPFQFRSLVRGLQYLTWTRPDISFSVNQVRQLLREPRTHHLIAVKIILRYLKGTGNIGLVYRRNIFHLNAFGDADWASSFNDRRSTTNYCIYFGSNPISWPTKRQHTVARSSTEAEYRSLAHTAAEIC